MKLHPRSGGATLASSNPPGVPARVLKSSARADHSFAGLPQGPSPALIGSYGWRLEDSECLENDPAVRLRTPDALDDEDQPIQFVLDFLSLG